MKDLIKKYTLGLYEKAVPAGLELGQKLEFIARCGFDFMELSIDESAEKQERLTWSRRKRAELAKS
ncbi:MAG: L-ribulose-5-phosphate 4-epimerase, partial [Clostridia bacterium]|nr:L-ribulose-5-phosphate 4-epimerase [Clostridia bacterium]